MRKTKIICTIGPATRSPEMIDKLIQEGMNVARLNFSHGDYNYHGESIKTLKVARKKAGKPLAILLDTQGPEIRTGILPDEGIPVKTGDEICLNADTEKCREDEIPISYKDLPKDVSPGGTILIDDGNLELTILRVEESTICCKVLNNGLIESRKGINVPGVALRMPILSEKDKNDLLFGIEAGVDYIAASFVRNEDDVLAIRNMLNDNGGGEILIIAKIENQEGVQNIDNILALADGVMVARGDLGVEVSYEQVPFIQKEIIKKALAISKPVIIATQMLDSMINNPRPTRAEVSDISNAIYESASAIMLSGETAKGKYPLECLKVMKQTALASENRINYRNRFYANQAVPSKTITGAVTNAAVNTAYNLDAEAIIVLTKSGRTAFSISRLRPDLPIITITPSWKTYNQMALNWGIFPFQLEDRNDFENLLKDAMDTAKESGIVKDGDLVVMAAGVPVGHAGRTNTLRIDTVGNVIARGRGLTPGKVTGRACRCRTASEGVQKFEDGDILITPSASQEMIPLIKRSAGLLIEQEDTHENAKTIGITLDIPVISELPGIMTIIKDARIISIDGKEGLVYNEQKK